MTDIKGLLGDEAEELLSFTCKGITKDQLNKPGGDIVERVYMQSDRSPQVLRNLQSMFGHGRLGDTGYVSILPVEAPTRCPESEFRLRHAPGPTDCLLDGDTPVHRSHPPFRPPPDGSLPVPVLEPWPGQPPSRVSSFLQQHPSPAPFSTTVQQHPSAQPSSTTVEPGHRPPALRPGP
jgi:hypothetical protein